ncbi:cellulose binding domain-containing protein [Nonomuraea ferruginea]
MRNTGGKSLDGWNLRWSFPGAQRVRDSWGAAVSQDGPVVTAKSRGKLRPGATAAFGFAGTAPS